MTAETREHSIPGGDRSIDFDALWAEQEAAAGPPPQLRAYGEVIELPRAVPMAIYSIKATTHVEALVATLGVLVGDERVERWVGNGATIVEFERMATLIGSIYRRDQSAVVEASE